MSQNATEPDANDEDTSRDSNAPTKKRRSKAVTQTLILVRRIHLYAGLFLLPWVFLYGMTGAMFNHHSLISDVTTYGVSAAALEGSALASLPTPEALAEQVVGQLDKAAPDQEIALARDHGAQFNNDIVLEVHGLDGKHSVHIDPVAKRADVIAHTQPEKLDGMLDGVHNISLPDNPYATARQAVPEILEKAGLEPVSSTAPMGWCKLNFLASIDGERARVTYVLRDGHVDVTRYTGEDGMTPRQFFLRLHTSHGQPPHWNGRMYWSLILDTMAIAMVTWGISGLVMWWQIKRTRLIGSIVIASSLLTAISLYLSMLHFYATTKL